MILATPFTNVTDPLPTPLSVSAPMFTSSTVNHTTPLSPVATLPAESIAVALTVTVEFIGVLCVLVVPFAVATMLTIGPENVIEPEAMSVELLAVTV